MHESIAQFKNSLLTGDFPELITQATCLLQDHPTATEVYGYLSLAHLLLGEEIESQGVWLAALENLTDEDLLSAQKQAAGLFREYEKTTPSVSADLRLMLLHYAWEIHQGNSADLLLLLQVAQQNEILDSAFVESLNILDFASSYSLPSKDSKLVSVLRLLIFNLTVDDKLRPFISALSICIPPIRRGVVLTGLAMKIFLEKNRESCAFALIDVAIEVDPERLTNFIVLSDLHRLSKNYNEAIVTARRYLELCRKSEKATVMEKANGLYNILSTMMKAGGKYQQEAAQYAEEYIRELQQLASAEESPFELSKNIGFPTFYLAFFLPYIRDNLPENQLIKNQVAGLANHCISQRYSYDFNLKINQERIRIGFMSNCFKKHSVGWLSRWLFHYLDQNRFDIHLYSTLNLGEDLFFRSYFSEYATSYSVADTVRLDRLIHDDRIQIMVDVDSLTTAETMLPLALKPAPVQVQWLGWDASSTPGIDYFIVDPYVLPSEAQAHYRETLWRLPECYLGIDGFEVGIPTFRKDSLGISSESIVFLCVQGGLKLNEHLVNLQLQIIREVPGSHFIVKSNADMQSVREFYCDLAMQQGISPERLSFPGRDDREITHRANLQIADVVLDSFPYNGATTTLETLWAGVPLVTRVGQQFAARNSYTFLMNCGVTEGIAYSDEEYVAWGIRLGTDETLRAQVKNKLFRSRRTATLWNAKTFTRQMEDAFTTMWRLYCESHEGTA